MALPEIFSSRAIASCCRSADEIGLCVLVVSTLLLLTGFALFALWRRRPGHARLYVLKVLYISVLMCLLLPFAPAVKLTSLWAIRLPPPGVIPMPATPPVVAPLSDGRLTSAVHTSHDSSGQPETFTNAVPIVSASIEPPAVAPAFRDPAAVYEFLVAVWAAGMCWQLVRLCRTLGALRGLVSISANVPDESALGQQFERQCASSNVPRPYPLLKTCVDLPSPVLVQFPLSRQRAAILIPSSYEESLGGEEMGAVLSHELSHWRHRDCAWYLLAGLAGAVLWAQPLVHFLCRSFKETCEEARDSEVVIDGCNSALYASLLLRLADQPTASGARCRSLPAAPGILNYRSSLERRIRNVMNKNQLAAASRQWMSLPLLTRAVVAGGLSFVAVAGVALIDRTPIINYQLPHSRELIDSTHPKYLVSCISDYPQSGPTPEGKVAFSDVELAAPEYLLPRMNFGVEARYKDGVLQLVGLPKAPSSGNFRISGSSRHQQRAGELVRDQFGMYRDAGPETIIWSGPISEASFIFETVAGVHKLRDTTGCQFWSDAATTPVPDLQLFRDASGNGRLLDKSGRLLWSGLLEMNESNGRIMSASQRSREIRNGMFVAATGVHYSIGTGYAKIEGSNGKVTLSDAKGSILWSGASSVQPVVFMREGLSFVLSYPNHSEAGRDETTRVRFDVQKAVATIEDRNHNRLGQKPAEMLEALTAPLPTSYDDQVETRRANTWQVGYIPPHATLHAVGTAYITYRASNNGIFRRTKLYRTEDGLRTGSSY